MADAATAAGSAGAADPDKAQVIALNLKCSAAGTMAEFTADVCRYRVREGWDDAFVHEAVVRHGSVDVITNIHRLDGGKFRLTVDGFADIATTRSDYVDAAIEALKLGGVPLDGKLCKAAAQADCLARVLDVYRGVVTVCGETDRDDLIEAAGISGSVDLLKYAKANPGADAKRVRKDEYSSMILYAIQHGRTTFLKLVLEKQVLDCEREELIDIFRGHSGIAAMRGNIELLKLMRKHGVSIGERELIAAAGCNHAACAWWILHSTEPVCTKEIYIALVELDTNPAVHNWLLANIEVADEDVAHRAVEAARATLFDAIVSKHPWALTDYVVACAIAHGDEEIYGRIPSERKVGRVGELAMKSALDCCHDCVIHVIDRARRSACSDRNLALAMNLRVGSDPDEYTRATAYIIYHKLCQERDR